MANPKKNSIHQQYMMRRASRSEYKDGLLRHNQRQENRLARELEQWEKAQRTVSKGLDKESQRFKQSSSSGYNPQRGINPKRNSLTEVTENGQPRFIPDYQYRNRATIAAQPSVAEHEQDSSRDQQSSETRDNNDAEKKSSDLESSVKSHKKQSKSSEGEGKKSSSKHGDHRRSSHSQRKSKHQGERESKDSDVVDWATPGSESTAPAADKKILKSAVVEAAVTPVKHIHGDKTTPSKSSKSSKKLAAGADNATLPLPTASDTTTTSTSAAASTTTTTTTAAQSASEDARPETASKTSSGGRSFSLCEDVHDPGDVIVSSRLLGELGWDGRRRYTNVWDSLSAPKHTSQVRSVRSRLQREFTQPPPSRDSSSKGLGGRSARTASLF